MKDIMKEKILFHSLMALNFSKTLLFASEHKLLHGLSKALGPLVKPPYEESDKDLIKIMQKKVEDLYREEANNVLHGYYPKELLLNLNPKEHLRRLPKLLIDSLKISRRRKVNLTKDFNQKFSESFDGPDYVKRNYHFQTDGYFSEHSAHLYEHQVEILFNGTAQSMRRMLIAHLKRNFPNKKFYRILEVAAGTGAATKDFSKSFEYEKYVATDISSQYLDLAKQKVNEPKVEFVTAMAEELPFMDEEFDLVFSVFLFHELPNEIRKKVLSESYRVLKNNGVFALCDSIQKDDDPRLNRVLENFPKDYHEPFYRDYTLWDIDASLIDAKFSQIQKKHILLSKYVSALKKM